VGDLRDSRVARGGDQLRDRRVARKRKGERVFAPARADKQYSHVR